MKIIVLNYTVITSIVVPIYKLRNRQVLEALHNLYGCLSLANIYDSSTVFTIIENRSDKIVFVKYLLPILNCTEK